MADDMVLWLEEVGKVDIAIVGGKGASLGEMIHAELPVPPGFAVTAQAFRRFIDENGIAKRLFSSLDVNVDETEILVEAEKKAKKIVVNAKIPPDIEKGIKSKYRELCKRENDEVYVAVCLSATTKDTSQFIFTGQQNTFLNIKGEANVLESVKKCWVSFYEARAIYYRVKQGIDHSKVNLSVVVQLMVNTEKSMCNKKKGMKKKPKEFVNGKEGELIDSAIANPVIVLVKKQDPIVIDILFSIAVALIDCAIFILPDFRNELLLLLIILALCRIIVSLILKDKNTYKYEYKIKG